MQSLQQILKSYWGYTSFRPLQEKIITSVVERKDTLALLPTGGGKSLCYQLPAIGQGGFCLVISPLIALMQDQVRRLKALNINAACLHSGMHYKEAERTLDNTIQNGYKLLYVSPERLQSRLFREYLPEFDLNLIAVDEAHCISQWGHDFRPDYLKISYLREAFKKVPILALTASATEEVQQDIIQQLALRNVQVFRQSFKRENIYYEIKYSEQKVSDAVEILKRQNESAIVYCRSRKQTEILTKYLKNAGIPSVCYHAGMNKTLRDKAQQEWMSDKIRIIVATTAFGMGIDKPDVRLVLHYDAPEHPEAYYQEAGRAGRDNKPSAALMLLNHSDIRRLKESTQIQFPPEAFLKQVYQSVCEYLQVPIGNAPDQYFDFDIAELCKRFTLPVLQTAHALKLLEQENLWSISEGVFHPATVYFSTDKSILDQLAHTYPDLAYITTNLLRFYGSLFHYPTPIRLSAIAKQTRLKQDVIHQFLLQLDKMNIIEYTLPKNGAQLYFNHTRVDSAHLLIDLQRINTLRKRHQTRTNAMLNLLQEHRCRECFLLSYFNEPVGEDCRHCDICESKYTVRLSSKAIYQQLLKQLTQPSLLEDIITGFHAVDKEKVIEALRHMMDEGKIVKDVKGLFSLRKQATE